MLGSFWFVEMESSTFTRLGFPFARWPPIPCDQGNPLRRKVLARAQCSFSRKCSKRASGTQAVSGTCGLLGFKYCTFSLTWRHLELEVIRSLGNFCHLTSDVMCCMCLFLCCFCSWGSPIGHGLRGLLMFDLTEGPFGD